MNLSPEAELRSKIIAMITASRAADAEKLELLNTKKSLYASRLSDTENAAYRPKKIICRAGASDHFAVPSRNGDTVTPYTGLIMSMAGVKRLSNVYMATGAKFDK